MEWFDCCAEFGRRVAPGPLQMDSAGKLAALYRELGIERAMVLHAAMHQEHPKSGNARVVDETRDHPRFAPTWAILPPQTEELGDVATFLAGMQQAGVRALWAFPKGYLLNHITFGPLFEEMRARNIPLFLKVADLGPDALGWERLTALLASTPELRVCIVLPSVWGQDRYFRPLVERYPGLHIITSLYMLEGGIAAFCRHYGSRQLLFGSSFPDCQPGGAYFSLLHADISDTEREAIAGGNLRRLLEEARI